LLTSGHNNTVKETKMPAPLVGLAIATATKMAAKKLAQQGAKKVAKTAASRASSNSAAAAKAVAPKKRPVKKLSPVKVLEPIKRPGPVKINTNPVTVITGPKKVKPKSYSQLKDMPNLVKIDSAKGNTIKKVAYRKRTSN
jgi:Flp pilus assembly protein TadG